MRVRGQKRARISFQPVQTFCERSRISEFESAWVLCVQTRGRFYQLLSTLVIVYIDKHFNKVIFDENGRTKRNIFYTYFLFELLRTPS